MDTISDDPKNVSTDISRRKFLKFAASAVVLPVLPKFPEPKSSPPSAEVHHRKLEYFCLSPGNPVRELELDSDPTLGEIPQRQDEFRDKYLKLDKHFTATPKPFTLEDIKNRLNPWGPHGKDFQEVAEKVAPEIGLLPPDVLLAYVVGKSLHESMWNSKDTIEGGVSMGLFQQETKAVLSGFPDARELMTARQQIEYEFGKILKAAQVVRKNGRDFTVDDLEYYYLGDSCNKPGTPYYDAFQHLKYQIVPVLLRNAAAYKNEDLLKVFDLLQTGDKKYGIWPARGNSQSTLKSKQNFNMVYGSFVEPDVKVTLIHNKKQSEHKITNEAQLIACYLRNKYGGDKLPSKISKADLLGHGHNNLYMALAHLGLPVVAYNDFINNSGKILRSKNFDLNLFLDNSQETKALSPLIPPITVEV